MSKRINPELASAGAAATVAKGYQAQAGSNPAPANYQRVAVIVHHGMGQQVPYETIEGVANSIWSQAQTPPMPPVVRNARLGIAGQDEIEPELVRAELRLEKTKEGSSQYFDLHVYESYWAPLTEGQVSISDVIWFLLRAGWNGWLNTSFGKFQRWLFGQEQIFKLPKIRLMVILASLLALIVSLVFINSVLAAAAAAHAIGSSKPFPSDGLLPALTADILLIDLAAALITLGVFIVGRFARLLAWLLIYGGAGLIVCAAVLMAVHLSGKYWPWQQLAEWDNWVHNHPFWVFWIWAAEVVAAYGVRWTLIEYVGDVTGYIAAYSVSKFWKLRQDIRDAAMKVMRAVYHARTLDGKAWLYDKIIVVGHSLGSVIGYDTLNSLLLEAVRSNLPLHVPERTRMFLTFGSPLDKTAFLFRTLKDIRSEIREVGAAAVQPMIADYAYRPQEWINLWSPADIISGELDYYDPPTSKNARYPTLAAAQGPNTKSVNNKRDPEATTPLKAHVEYWDARLLATELWRAVTT